MMSSYNHNSDFTTITPEGNGTTAPAKGAKIQATVENHNSTLTKSKLAPPTLSAANDETLELKDMLPSEPPPPPAGDIMRLAQTGDEVGIRRLLDSGIVSATYADSEGITPLHVCLSTANASLFFIGCHKYIFNPSSITNK